VVLPGQEARGVVLGVARALGGKRMGRGGKHDGEGAGGHLRQGTCFAEDEPRGGLTWGAPVGRRGGLGMAVGWRLLTGNGSRSVGTGWQCLHVR
jgi:hypothetical protein